MSEYFLGWGSPNYSGYPYDFPYLVSNKGTLVDSGGNWQYGVVPDGSVPAWLEAKMVVTYSPADGGPVQTAEVSGSSIYGNPMDLFRYGFWEFIYGVFEIQGFVGGVSCNNKLILVASPGEMYATITYYAEGGGEDTLPAFWTEFNLSREVP